MAASSGKTPATSGNSRRRRVSRVVGALLLLVPSLLIPLLVSAQEAAADEPEGWYSETQAERGREAYLANCAKCHSRDLQARSTYISLYRYPALTGQYFLDRWEGENVRALYQVIRHTMPLDAPGSLDAESYADIVAYILQENGFPAGQRELPAENEHGDRLRSLVIERAAMTERPRAQQPEETDLEQSVEDPALAAEPATEEPEEPEPEQPPAAEDLPQEGAWYTEAQAVRGDQQFVEHCSRCHGRALQGVGVAPSLAGGNFMARWEGEPVAELFRIASSLMPLDGQGELDRQTYADLVAFILRENGFPAGDTELPPNMERLQEFVITPELAEVPEVP